jgi:MYXO-CTERM domain-containing protein
MKTKQVRIVLAAFGALALTSLPSSASAHPALRDEMRNQTMFEFDLKTREPNYLPCSVCHEHGNTGIGSVRTPFGRAVRARGLDLAAAEDEAARSENVFDVIHKMDLEKVDSDGDGVTDMNELRAKTDPNTYGPVRFVDETEVKHGCQCGVAGRSSSSSTATWLGVFALGLAALNARRANHRGRPSRA